MAGHKAVIKYQDGRIIKGWVQNFKPERGFVMVNPLTEYSEEEKLEIKISELKAVFFVKDFIGNSTFKKAKTFENYPPSTPTQRHIIVHFKDGEKLYGTSYSYNPNKNGFFVYPIDPMDNNFRIFVLKDATENIEFP